MAKSVPEIKNPNSGVKTYVVINNPKLILSTERKAIPTTSCSSLLLFIEPTHKIFMDQPSMLPFLARRILITTTTTTNTNYFRIRINPISLSAVEYEDTEFQACAPSFLPSAIPHPHILCRPLTINSIVTTHKAESKLGDKGDAELKLQPLPCP